MCIHKNEDNTKCLSINNHDLVQDNYSSRQCVECNVLEIRLIVMITAGRTLSREKESVRVLWFWATARLAGIFFSSFARICGINGSKILQNASDISQVLMRAISASVDCFSTEH